MESMYKSEPSSIKPTVLRYALIGSLLLIAYTLISQLTGLTTHPNWTLRTLSSLVSIIIMFFVFRSAIISYRDQENEGLVTLGKAFMITFWISLVMAIISFIFFIITVTYIDSSIIDFTREESIRGMEEKGMSDDEIEQTMVYIDLVSGTTGMSITIFFFTLILGAILGLVTALIYKKEVPVKV